MAIKKTLLLILLLATGDAFANAAKPLWQFAPGQGYVDDAMAFSPDGKRLAFLHTDAATFAKAMVLDIATRKIVHTIALTNQNDVPNQLAFVGSNQLIYVARASTRKRGNHNAALIDLATGKTLKKVRGYDRMRVIKYDGVDRLAAIKRRADSRGATFRIELLDVGTLKRVGRAKKIRVRKDGMIKKLKLRELYWTPGMTQVVGLQRGRYDKKNDVRLPDQAVAYDVFKGKTLWSNRPRDLVEWTKVLGMRDKLADKQQHREQRRFLRVAETLDKLLYVSAKSQVYRIKTTVPWRKYEPKSLRFRETDDGTQVYFSMTVDPVNRDAVARKKADKERMDLYQLLNINSEKPTAKLLGKVLTGKRDFHWALGASHFAYLRKLKGFGRGGKAIELYKRQ